MSTKDIVIHLMAGVVAGAVAGALGINLFAALGFYFFGRIISEVTGGKD